MLSMIYRLTQDFERRHGIRPNLLYLHPDHLQRFQLEYPDPRSRTEIFRRLGLEIAVSSEAVHPHVAWSSQVLRDVV